MVHILMFSINSRLCLLMAGDLRPFYVQSVSVYVMSNMMTYPYVVVLIFHSS